jgi:hypothetical protein
MFTLIENERSGDVCYLKKHKKTKTHQKVLSHKQCFDDNCDFVFVTLNKVLIKFRAGAEAM